METLAKTTLSLFGLGYLPRIPGTWGSLGAALIYLLLASILPAGIHMAGACLLAAGAFSVLTVALGTRAQAAYGSKDPRQVVADEAAGLFLSGAFVTPVAPVEACACAFLLFRLFDILKPPPARQLEALPGGWGILLDDLAAAAYAWLAGHAFFLFVLPALRG